MNPLVGLQGPQTFQPPMTWQQGMPQGLMGNVMRPPSLMNYQPGDWSQVAYQMAGSPNQGPYPNVAVPPGTSGGIGGGGGGGSAGGTAMGLLGALARNPSLLKSAGNAVSSLWGPAAGSPAAILAGGSPTLAPIGVDSISTLPSVAASVDAGASGGLMGGGATAYGTEAGVAPASSLVSEIPGAAAGGETAGAGALGGGASADAGATGAGLGAGAGAATAAGLFAIPAILAATVAQHDRDAAQYASMLSDLNAGPSSPGYNGTAMEIAADIANGQTKEYPAEVLQKAQQLGLYQTAQNLGAYKGQIGQGRVPASRNKQ